MRYKLNKLAILEAANPLAAANAAFLNGGKIAADEIQKDAAGNKIASAKAKLDKERNSAIQNATNGDIMDPLEKVKVNRLLSTVK